MAGCGLRGRDPFCSSNKICLVKRCVVCSWHGHFPSPPHCLPPAPHPGSAPLSTSRPHPLPAAPLCLHPAPCPSHRAPSPHALALHGPLLATPHGCFSVAEMRLSFSLSLPPSRAARPECQSLAVVVPLQDVVVGAGELALFECLVAGPPDMDVDWLSRGRLLQPALLKCKMHFDGRKCKLLLTSVHEDDSGIYTCKLSTAKGKRWARSSRGYCSGSSLGVALGGPAHLHPKA